MDYESWKKLNGGIEMHGSNVPEHVQQQVYTLVSRAFIPELAVAIPRERRQQGGGGGPDEGGGPDDEQRPATPLLAPFAANEGWAQIVGGGFPKPTGTAGVQMVTHTHLSSIFSEVTHGNSGLVRSPLVAANSAVGEMKPPPSMNGAEAMPGTGSLRRDDFAWLSIVYTLLFFTSSPQTGAPYAFVDLRKICVANVDENTQILTLVGAPEPDEGDAAEAGNSTASTSDRPSVRSQEAASTPVAIVLLLPDGRWQELSLPKLELRLPSSSGLTMWSNHIAAGGQGKLTSGLQKHTQRATEAKVI